MRSSGVSIEFDVILMVFYLVCLLRLEDWACNSSTRSLQSAERRTSGAKARIHSATFMYGLKAVPFTKHFHSEFSASYKAVPVQNLDSH